MCVTGDAIDQEENWNVPLGIGFKDIQKLYALFPGPLVGRSTQHENPYALFGRLSPWRSDCEITALCAGLIPYGHRCSQMRGINRWKILWTEDQWANDTYNDGFEVMAGSPPITLSPWLDDFKPLASLRHLSGLFYFWRWQVWPSEFTTVTYYFIHYYSECHGVEISKTTWWVPTG